MGDMVSDEKICNMNPGRFQSTLLLLQLLFIPNFLFSQPPIPRDTSFTVYSAFIKEKRKYPDIEIVQPQGQKEVRVKKNIVYSTPGGRALMVDVFYPARQIKKPCPGVLLIHGGGWRSGDRSQQVPMAEQLAARGYVAVTVEYRLTLEATYPAAVHDVKAAIRWMRANAKQFHLDTSKIAVLGCSAGGQLAALVGTTNNMKKFEGMGGHSRYSSRVQAIIDIDGVLAFKHPESEEGAAAAQWLGGSYEEKPAIWEEASPLHHVDRNTPPILFVNSSNPRFHAGRNDMISKLDHLGIYSQVHEIANTPHPLWLFTPWFGQVMGHIYVFLYKIFR